MTNNRAFSKGNTPITESPAGQQPESAFDPAEPRRYGGIAAAILAPLAGYLLALRRRAGVARFLKIFAHLPEKLSNSLFIYTRVKASLSHLNDEIEIKVKPQAPAAPPRRVFMAPKTSAPSKNWRRIAGELGYDPRETSHVGIARRVSSLRQNARRRARQSLGLTGQRPVQTDIAVLPAAARNRRSHELPMIYGEIWPPLALPNRITPPVRVCRVPARTVKDCGSRYTAVLGYDEFYRIYNHDCLIAARADGLSGPGQPVRAPP